MTGQGTDRLTAGRRRAPADRDGHHRAEGRETGRRRHGGTVPAGYGRRASQAALRVEDRRPYCDTEHRPELAQRVEDRGGLAERGGGDRVQRGGGRGGDGHRHAHARDDERRQVPGVAAGRSSQRDDPREPGGLQQQAGHDQHARPYPVRERAGQRGDQQRRGGPGQEPQPGCQRRVAGRELEELARQERSRVDRGAGQKARGDRGGEAGRAEQPERDHRLRGPALPGDEHGDRHGAQISAAAPAETSTSPGMSSRVRGPRLSASPSRAPATAATPTGTFTQNTQCQDSPWVTAPPISGPTATPRPEIPPQMPMMAPRRSAGKAEVRIVRLSGVMNAAPSPCTARAVISSPTSGASAQAADAVVNTARPAVYTRRRPSRSPSAAAVMMPAPNAML